MLTLQFDGLFRGAPQDFHLSESAGFMCYGWVILRDNAVIAHGHGGYARIQDASSNVAEYLALIEGLEALLDMHAAKERIVICGDAKSVIEQMEGRAGVVADSIKPLHRKARKLANNFRHLSWTWAPLRFNHAADALTRRALRQIHMNPEQFEAIFESFRGHPIGRRQKNTPLLPLLDLRIYQAT